MRFSLSGILKMLFGDKSYPAPPPSPPTGPPPYTGPPPPVAKVPKRQPVFVQIGFDFGTAYSKVVTRDVNAGIARVFLPPNPSDKKLPFLIPSVLYFGTNGPGNAWLSVNRQDQSDEELRFPKLALCAISGNATARGNVMQPYERCSQAVGLPLDQFVEHVVTFFMFTVLRNVLTSLRNGEIQLTAHPEDWVSVCVAIPTDNLKDPVLAGRFERCLRRAFRKAATGAQVPILSTQIAEIEKRWTLPTREEVDPYQCMLYPEVSANMVAYTQSRSSSEGLFQMIDVGAGTVDVSFFSFVRNPEGPRLSNFSGQVSFCGSSRIERDACDHLRYPHHRVSELRAIKEGNSGANPAQSRALSEVRDLIGEEVGTVVHRSIAEMLSKMPNKPQMRETRFLFVGGGSTPDPYQKHAIGKWTKLGKDHEGVVNIPFPIDLEAPANREGWFQRLTVAYGLSFDPSNRPETTLPDDHQTPPTVFRDQVERRVAPSKDEC